MALTPGTRLGPYEITVQIGVGGMGEVYRARDTKLDRDVAIKVLPESLAGDPDRPRLSSGALWVRIMGQMGERASTDKLECQAIQDASI